MFSGQNSPLSPGGIIEKVSNTAKKTAMQKLIEEQLKYIKDPLLRKHYEAESNVTKRRIKTPQGMIQGGAQVMEMESTGDGTSLFDFKANQSIWTEKDGKRVGEYIVIGDTTYVKDYTDNKWWKQTKKHEKPDEKISPLPIEEDYKSEVKETIPTGPEPEEPKNVGEEKCPNAPQLTCYKYEETDNSMKEFSGSALTRTFWFDNQQYLLRKEVSGSGGDTNWTEYEYDNINIIAPSPTKDVPAGEDIGGYLINSMQGGSGNVNNFPNIEELKSEMKNYNIPNVNNEPPAESNEQAVQDNSSGDTNVNY